MDGFDGDNPHRDARREVDGVELGRDLADVGAMPLDQLLRSDDTPLTNSLRQLLAAMDRLEEPMAAFGNVP